MQDSLTLELALVHSRILAGCCLRSRVLPFTRTLTPNYNTMRASCVALVVLAAYAAAVPSLSPVARFLDSKTVGTIDGADKLIGRDGDDTGVPPSQLNGRDQDTSVPPSQLNGRDDDTGVPPSQLNGRDQETSVPPSLLNGRNQETSVPPSLLNSRDQDTSVPPSQLNGRAQDTSVPPSQLNGRDDDTGLPPSQHDPINPIHKRFT